MRVARPWIVTCFVTCFVAGLGAVAGCHHAPPPRASGAPLPGPDPMKTTPRDSEISAREPTVELTGSGSGARALLRIAPPADARAPVELRFDVVGATEGRVTAPTPVAIVHADLQVTAADGSGTSFQLTVTSTDTHYRDGEPRAAAYETALGGLVGVTWTGHVSPRGATGKIAIHGDAVTTQTFELMELLGAAWLPPWPAAPEEPIGAGATWTTHASYALAGLQIDEAVAYEVRAREGTTWVIRGMSTLSGHDQMLGPASVTGIRGGGQIDITYTDGTLVPTLHARRTLQFAAAAAGHSHPIELKLGNDAGPDVALTPSK